MDNAILDLHPGFADPVAQSQAVFRAALTALSRPGTIVQSPDAPQAPAPLHDCAAALLLALADMETPVWLDHAARSKASVDHLRFHCGCPIIDAPKTASFALIADAAAMLPFSAFNQGADEYPDGSATLIIQVPALTGGAPLCLRGPGILDRIGIAPIGLPDAFPAWAADNHAQFPRGVDVILAAPHALAALPRSVRLEV